MKKTALALFRNQNQVETSFQELIDAGFLRADLLSFHEIGDLRPIDAIASIPENRDDPYGDQESHLFRSLRRWGIPWEDALLFTEGVRRGGKLAVVFTLEENMELVIRILKRHGALDLDVRRRFSKAKRMQPSQGDTSSPFTRIHKESNFHHDFTEWLCENRDLTGPRDPVRIYEIQDPNEDLGLERNLNE